MRMINWWRQMSTSTEQHVERFVLPGGETAWIRMMCLQDVPKVHDLETKAYKDPWSLSHFRHEITDSTVSWPLIAECGVQLLGYAIVWFVEDELHIANIATAPEQRRKGIASQLLAVILEEGLNRQAQRAYLEVRGSNVAAFQLYKKFKIDLIGTRMRYYSDGEDAILMHRFLRPGFDSNITASS